jgi:type IV secretory pathway VirB3-like protein
MYGNLSLCPVYGADCVSTAVPVPPSSSVPAAEAVIVIVMLVIAMVVVMMAMVVVIIVVMLLLLLVIVAMAVMTTVPFFTACRDRYRMAETKARGAKRLEPAKRRTRRSVLNYCLPIPSI